MNATQYEEKLLAMQLQINHRENIIKALIKENFKYQKDITSCVGVAIISIRYMDTSFECIVKNTDQHILAMDYLFNQIMTESMNNINVV